VPELLIEQLKTAGRMVIPIGPSEAQHLTLVAKDHEGVGLLTYPGECCQPPHLSASVFDVVASANTRASILECDPGYRRAMRAEGLNIVARKGVAYG
jgi:protein-L-isoaspartate O-methyltransferase